VERWRHGYGYVRPGTSLYKKSNKLDFSYRVRVPLILFALAFSFSTVHQPYRVGERVGRQILEGRKEEMTHRFTRRGRVHTGGGDLRPQIRRLPAATIRGYLGQTETKFTCRRNVVRGRGSGHSGSRSGNAWRWWTWRAIRARQSPSESKSIYATEVCRKVRGERRVGISYLPAWWGRRERSGREAGTEAHVRGAPPP
jgi:hypothetical protein